MFLPEGLYTLSARDQQVTWLDPLFTRVELVAAAADLQANYVVPDGRALILQSVHTYGEGGGAQNCTYIEIALDLPGSPLTYTYLSSHYLGAPGAAVIGNNRAQMWSGSIVVPEKWRVAGAAGFSAAALANSVFHSVVGLLIPIGNIQRI